VAQFQAQLAVITRQTGEFAGFPIERDEARSTVWRGVWGPTGGLLDLRLSDLGVKILRHRRDRFHATRSDRTCCKFLFAGLQQEEKKRVTAAGVRSNAVAWIIDLMTILISARPRGGDRRGLHLVAALMAGAEPVEAGRESIGGETSTNASPLQGHDELTDLAHSFNQMTRICTRRAPS